MLTDSNLVAQLTGPLTGVPVASPSSATPVAPSPTATLEPSTPARTSLAPVKLQAKRKAKSNQLVEVPESGAWDIPGGREDRKTDSLAKAP